MYEWVSLWPKDGGRPHGECGKPAFIGTTYEGRKTLNESLKKFVASEQPASETAEFCAH